MGQNCGFFVSMLYFISDLNIFSGAAGFDSSLFMHLKRNWSWVTRGGSLQSTDRKSLTKPVLRMDDDDEKEVSPDKKSKTTVDKSLVKKKGVKRKLPEDENQEEKAQFKGAGVPYKLVKPAKKTRVIKDRPKAPKKPYYDEVDKEALKLMTKLRVEWTKEEDTILLISRVAGSYLCQNSVAVATSMVPYVIGKVTLIFFC